MKNLKIETVDLAQLKALHESGKLVGAFKTSATDYHNAPGMSSSTLLKVDDAPAVYQHYRENPEEATDAQEFGQLLHTLTLEPEAVSERYAVAPPEIDRRGTKAWNEFAAKNVGKIHLKHAGEYGFARAEKIAKAAREHSRASLLEGLKEISFFWKDPKTGILCKCRPDNLTMKGAIVDYKSAEAIYPARAWSSQVYKYGYHVQAAFYLDGVVHALEQSGHSLNEFPVPKHFVHYAQSKQGPYLVKPWAIGESSLQLGRRKVEELLQTVLKCEKSGVYPGYPESIEVIECPEYAWKDETDEGS